MKYEIEAASQFLTQLLFPDISHHAQSEPNLIATHKKDITSSSCASILNKTDNNHAENNEEKTAKLFSKFLSKNLAKKFAQHWYEDAPIKGQAYRCILVDCENNFVDKVILTSARKASVKDVENRLKKANLIGFQMWIDPGEVEVEYLSPLAVPVPLSSSPSSPYKSTVKANEILYSIHRNVLQNSRILRPPSPPSSSPSPSVISTSPPSSPAPSSYFPSSPSSDAKMPFFTRQKKPIRISHRQNDEIFFDKMENMENVVKDLDHISSEFDDINNNNVKSTFAVPQHAM